MRHLQPYMVPIIQQPTDGTRLISPLHLCGMERLILLWKYVTAVRQQAAQITVPDIRMVMLMPTMFSPPSIAEHHSALSVTILLDTNLWLSLFTLIRVRRSKPRSVLPEMNTSDPIPIFISTINQTTNY